MLLGKSFKMSWVGMHGDWKLSDRKMIKMHKNEEGVRRKAKGGRKEEREIIVV